MLVKAVYVRKRKRSIVLEEPVYARKINKRIEVKKKKIGLK